MKRIVTNIVIIIVIIATVWGLSLALCHAVGDMFWDYDEPTWIG